ncbi:hypothetical protein [Mycolicibacterium llatzerense]|uniref:hypothetical protein n=1 Tax=Mycolicibacterium llatzerense TaxID=280871 RepID=UPI0021B610A0|nr:hypothetical protein [Mycolicibacterium llatzerense]MCT7366112.1 hypothetical protein [Mycolicibacterium llatzerense]
MNKFVHVAAVTATVIGMELAGLSGATQAMADPEDEDIIADQLCPFRNVIDSLGGDDQCDPGFNNDNGGGLFYNNGMPCDSVAFKNPACDPTVNVNVNHEGEVTHNVNVNGDRP